LVHGLAAPVTAKTKIFRTADFYSEDTKFESQLEDGLYLLMFVVVCSVPSRK
jgi:hypothetical protein